MARTTDAGKWVGCKQMEDIKFEVQRLWWRVLRRKHVADVCRRRAVLEKNAHSQLENEGLKTELDMEESFSTRPKGNERQSKAREILDGLYLFRIDPSTVKMLDFKPHAKGGKGTVVIGTEIAPEEVASWVPEQFLKTFFESKLAIKKLEWDREDAEASAKFFNSFANELSLMATLNHPNVIRFTRFVEDLERGDAWVITPWMPNGNLREFLASGEWDVPERVSLIQDTLSGLEYLHSIQPPICHGDLKPMNILVDPYYNAVITDIVSARAKRTVDAAEETDIHSELPAISIDDIVQELMTPRIKFDPSTMKLTLAGYGYTFRWTAPEVLNSGALDLPSDMWSIGWICWEIFTGELLFEELGAMGPIVSKIVQARLPAFREEADLSPVLRLCSLMMDCWMSKPAKRIDVSTFRRKVGFLPSATPSVDRSGGSKVRSMNLALELGRLYGLQHDTVMAESHFQSAIEVATRTKDDVAWANALNGLGGVYNAQSRYPEAEKAVMEAHDIHSRLGNERGAADALNGLGRVYGGQSRYREAEKAFMDAHEIHSRISNDQGAGDALNCLGGVYSDQSRYREAEKAFMDAHEIHSRIGNHGAADALNSLGGVYGDQSRYREAEKAFMDAHKIHSRIGTCIGTATALIGLGNTYDAQSRGSEAEQAYKDALKILSRIDNGPRAINVPSDLEDISDGEPWDPEDEETRRKASGIHSHTPTATRTWNEQEDEEQPREIPPAEPRNLYEIGTTPAPSSVNDGTSTSHDSESEYLPVPSTPDYKAAKASLPEPSSPLYSPQTSATSHNTPRLLQLSNRLTYQASAFPQLASGVDPAPNDDRQKRLLAEQPATINYLPASATEELVDLLQVLGRAASQAVRNKHKIFSVLRVAHDTCNYVVQAENTSAGQKNTDVKRLLDRLEHHCVVLDSLEEILLEFAEILPSEITVVGPELYSSWLQSRAIFAGILDKLCHPPFPEISYKTQDIAEDTFFDDCSWLSRLLYSGIDAEVAVQFADPPSAHPVLAVTNGLHYLERTRELVLDMATLLAQALAATSPDHDSELGQRESSPPTAAGRDWLIQALADSFLILDLDTALEASTTQELASKWTEIKTSLTSRSMSTLGK